MFVFAKLREAKQPKKLENVKALEIARIYAKTNMNWQRRREFIDAD